MTEYFLLLREQAKVRWITHPERVVIFIFPYFWFKISKKNSVVTYLGNF